MLAIITRRDINIESKKIPANTEVGVIGTALPVGTLMAMVGRNDLVTITERESDIDPRDPFELDLPKCVAALRTEECEELLKLLAQRLELDATDDDDPEPLADDLALVQVFADHPKLKTAADALAKADIDTVGQLRAHVDSGAALDDIPGIGKPTADKIADVPGLLFAPAE